MKDHFVQVPVTLLKIRHSREFLASPSGYLYLLMLSWAWRKRGANIYKDTPERIKYMNEMHGKNQLGLVHSVRKLSKLSGLSKSTVENALSKLEAIGFIRKQVLEDRQVGTYYQLGILNEDGRGETTFLKEWCDRIDTELESDLMFAGIILRTVFGPDDSPAHDEAYYAQINADFMAEQKSEAAFREWFKRKVKRRGATAYFDDSVEIGFVFRAALEMGSEFVDDIIENTKRTHGDTEYRDSLVLRSISPDHLEWKLMVVTHVVARILDERRERHYRLIPNTDESGLADLRKYYALDKSFYEWENK